MKGALGYLAGGWSLNGIWSFQTGPHWEPFRAGAQNLRNAAGGHCSVADVESGNCVNKGGDYLLTRGRNERPDSSLSTFGGVSRSTWGNGWCPGGVLSHGPCAGGSYNQAGLPVFTAPCLGCVSNLGRNQFVGPGQWQADLTVSKNFKLTERFNLKFDAAAFNVFNRVNFLLATNSSTTHNEIRDPLFGKAGGTLDARTMQFGLKLSF
jgi:hypothetical protein